MDVGKARILLDVAELGPHSYTGHGGVRRVIENTVRRMVQRPEVDLRFTGIGPLDAAEVASTFGIEPAAFHSRTTGFLQRAGRQARKFILTDQRRNLSARVTRRSLHHLAQIEQTLAEATPSETMEWAQVFHSTYRPLPAWARQRRSLATVVTVYDLIPLNQPELAAPHFAAMLRKILSSIAPDTWILCISQWVRDEFCAFTGHAPERVTVMPLAASAELFHPCDPSVGAVVRQRYGLADTPYILSLGALDVRKNVGHLISSFRRLITMVDAPDLRLVLVGSEAGAAQLRKSLAADDPVMERIVFTGRVQDCDLAAIYSGALAFAFPSLAEGFGLPVLEAMQCGTPVICSNTSSLPEIIGSAGVLLDPQDEDAWVEAMVKVVNDSRLRARLADQGLTRAKLFSWDKSIDAVVAAYKTAAIER